MVIYTHMAPEERVAHRKGSISERFFTFADPVRTGPLVVPFAGF
jgi:hypothetical protein